MGRLWDILDAARAVLDFTKDMHFDAFVKDRMVRSAVERNLQIIGEAARHVSQNVKDEHPNISWRSMVGLRNVLTHEYGDIRYEVIWRIIREDLPPLIGHLEEMGVDNPPTADGLD